MAKVIIAVSVCVVFLVACGLALYFTFRKKKNSNNVTIIPEPQSDSKEEKQHDPVTEEPKQEEEQVPTNGMARVKIVDDLIESDVPILETTRLETSEDKKTVTIFNTYTKVINNVFLCVYDGDSDMPIYQWEKFEPMKQITMEIPIDYLSNISKTLTFDKIQFRLTSTDINFKS